MNKQQIINDAKHAGNLAKRGWEKEYDFIEIDLDLLERLAKYARLLAMSIKE